MEYRRLGITRFLLRGPDQDRDAPVIGRDLVPELRRLILQGEQAGGAA